MKLNKTMFSFITNEPLTIFKLRVEYVYLLQLPNALLFMLKKFVFINAKVILLAFNFLYD